MIGTAIGQYKIVSKLGEGGMGIVYVAEHQLIGRKAAVKLLRPECSSNVETVSRFFNEARSIALIKHSGLVDVFDFSYLQDRSAYIVMELLEGESVGERLDRETRLPLHQILQIGRQVAAAVGAAHAKNIVHRDLKPDNIFLTRDDVSGGTRIKVLDFGIAKLGETNDSVFKTKAGVMMGTPLYMSPEQCRGAKNLDGRADIYALGCMLYEMVCGQPPFIAEIPAEVVVHHLTTPPPPLRKMEPSVNGELEALVMRCLAKNADHRPQTMTEVVVELDRIASTLSSPAMIAAPPLQRPTEAEAEVGRARRTGVQSMPPGSTTMSSAAGQTMEPTAKSRKPLWIGLGAAIALGGAAAAVLLASGPSSTATPVPAVAPAPVAAPIAAPVPEAKPVAPVEPKPAPPPEPTPPAVAVPQLVQLRIESDPAGASVFRMADGVLLGETPYVDTVQKGTGKSAYILKLDGYKDANVTLPIAEDGQVTEVLAKRESRKRDKPAAAAPAPVSEPKPPPKPTRESKDGTLPF